MSLTPSLPRASSSISTSTDTNLSRNRSVELSLLALAWVIVTAFYALATLGAKGHLPGKLWAFLAVIALISGGIHVAIRRVAPRSSQILLPVATLLNGIGYVEIARWNPTRAAYQAGWFFISAVALVGTLFAVKRIRDFDRYRYLILLTAVILLVLPMVPGVGVSVYGARLWVAVGPISFQPIEFAKVLLVFFFASYFAANRVLLSTPTQRLMGRQIVPPRVLIPILFAWGFAIAVLGAENDIGFAMLLFALFIALLWTATGLKSYLALGVGLFIAGAFTVVSLFAHVASRVSLWLDPWSAKNFAFSSQLADGWFSVASGGMTGTGLGLGQSGNIPEISSDMIFAALGEELGFIGLVVIVSLFVLLVTEAFRIAQRSRTDYVRLVSAGLGATLGLQAFFIMAGVLRLLPLTGIVLPFMAYGGSSLVANYMIIGFLLRISDENEQEDRGGNLLKISFD